jgi:uncharacterized caspase-like protein
MSTLYGLAIGVERYRSPKFKSVRYAEKDASDFRDAFIALGGADENFALLKSEDVTFATMNTRLKRVTRDAGKDDSLVIFFAGHGLYTAGRSYLVCSDSDIHEIPTTAISLEEIFDYLRASQCTQSTPFHRRLPQRRGIGQQRSRHNRSPLRRGIGSVFQRS